MNKTQPTIKHMNNIQQFDSLSSTYDSLIDECFYEWCSDNNITYWSDETGEDYPDDFKCYFMANNIG